MADVRAAILNAVSAAAHLHVEENCEAAAQAGNGRIDVFGMLLGRDIPVLFRPLAGLLGAYLPAEPAPGVLITTQRPLSVQRFTAAHELGHVLLKHQPSIDDEGMLRRTPFASRPAYDLQEVQADAFAIELLAPRWLVTAHLHRQKLTRNDLVQPPVVYQLSLRLGVSYAAMGYILERYKAIDTSTRERLFAVPPRRIKQSIAQGIEPDSWHGDVWLITERDEGMLIEGSRSDLVSLQLREHSGSGYLWTFDALAATGLRVVHDRRAELDEENAQEDRVGGVVIRRVIAQPEREARGAAQLKEIRPWQPAQAPLHSVSLKLELTGPLRVGLLDDEKRRLLGAA